MTTPNTAAADAAWPSVPGVTPVIETARLTLRLHRLDDLAGRFAVVGDESTMRFIGGPQSAEENWARIQRYAGHWALLGHGLFVVQEKSGGRLIGEVGLARFERGLGADFDRDPEAAWLFAAAAHGQGFAQEAMLAALAWFEGRFGVGRQVCLIGRDNAPSLRLAEKLGFAPYREADYKGHPVILHERLPAALPGAPGRATAESC